MKSHRFYIGIALAFVLLGGTALALNGNLLKGSFDAYNASKDLKITNVNTPAAFYVGDAAPLTIAYTLDKDAYNLFISMSGPDDTKKAQKFFALNASDMSKGDHAITMSPADTKNFFNAAGQYRITIIAYNQDNEISDYTSKTSNVSLGTAKASVSLWDSLSKLKDQPAASTTTNTATGAPAGNTPTPTPTPAETGTVTSKNLGLKVSVANKIQDEETGDMYVQLQVEKPSTSKITNSKITNGDLKIIIEGEDIKTKSYNLSIQGDSIIFANNAVPTESVTVNGAKLGAIDKSVSQSGSVFGNIKLPWGMSKSDGKTIKFVVLPPVQISLAKTKWQPSALNWTLVYTDSSYQAAQQQEGVVDVPIEKPSLIVDPPAGKSYFWYAYDNKGTYYYLDFNVRNQGGLIPKQLLKKMKDSNATLANAITDDGKSLSIAAAKASLCEYVDGIQLYWQGPFSKNTYGFMPWKESCKNYDYKKAQGALITELRSIPKGGEFHVKYYSAKNFSPYLDFSPLGSIDWVKLLDQ